MAAEKVILGLTGGMCSGKNTFGDFLIGRYGNQLGGGSVISSSDAAREYIANEGLGEPTRDLTREVAATLRQRHSPTYLVDWALQRFNDNEGIQIISGIYTVPERKRIAQVGGLVVAIHASDNERKRRMGIRLRAGEEIEDEFDRLDQEDMHATTTDQRTASVMEIADVHLHDLGSGVDFTETYEFAARQIFTKLAVEVS